MLMSQKGQVKKNSGLSGLCQSGVFSSLTTMTARAPSEHFGPWRSQKSQILSAVISTVLWPPKLMRCITWFTPFVKKKVRTLSLRAM